MDSLTDMAQNYTPARMTKGALRIIFDSCVTNDIRYYTWNEPGCSFPLLTPGDLNRAKYVRFGKDIRLIEII